MLVIVLIISILTFFGMITANSRLTEIEQRLRVRGSFLDDDAIDEAFGKPTYLETPQERIPKKPAKKAIGFHITPPEDRK